jgi:hypothetical protein
MGGHEGATLANRGRKFNRFYWARALDVAGIGTIGVERVDLNARGTD